MQYIDPVCYNWHVLKKKQKTVPNSVFYWVDVGHMASSRPESWPGDVQQHPGTQT